MSVRGRGSGGFSLWGHGFEAAGQVGEEGCAFGAQSKLFAAAFGGRKPHCYEPGATAFCVRQCTNDAGRCGQRNAGCLCKLGQAHIFAAGDFAQAKDVL